MTKTRRFLNIVEGVAMCLAALLLIRFPEYGLQMITAVLSLTMTVRGFGTLWFYFTMARHMVGGRYSLYIGIIYLDIGIFTSTLLNNSQALIILYLIGVHLFAGVVDILRGFEEKGLKAPSWRGTVMFGFSSVVVSAALFIGGLMFDSVELVVYVYSAGLIYSGLVRIAGAFRRTAIVYIQ